MALWSSLYHGDPFGPFNLEADHKIPLFPFEDRLSIFFFLFFFGTKSMTYRLWNDADEIEKEPICHNCFFFFFFFFFLFLVTNINLRHRTHFPHSFPIAVSSPPLSLPGHP